MTRHILSTGIASLIATCIITKPRPAYGAGDKPVGLDEPVEGEEPIVWPDEVKTGADSAQDDQGGASGDKKVDTGTEPPGKPPEVKSGDPEVEVPPLPPGIEGDKEVDAPDPKEAAKAAADQKQAEEQAKAEKEKAESDRKAAEEAAKGKPVEIKLPTEAEIDAMQPKAGAPAAVIKDFKTLKETVVKPALAEVRRLKAELEEKAKAPALTPEIEARLKLAEEDRQWREAFTLENDPKLTEEFTAKTTKSEENLWKTLKKHGLTDDNIEELKKAGVDSEKGREYRNKIVEAAKMTGDEFMLDEIKDAFKARDAVAREKSEKIEALRGQQGGLETMRVERDKADRMGWAKECDQKIIEAVRDQPLFLLKELPATATDAEKAEAEKHNKELTEKVVPAFHEGVKAIYARDPDKTMRYLVDSIRLPKVVADLDATKKELQAAQDRVKELEGDTTRMKRVATPTQKDSVPPPGKRATSNESPGKEISAEEAMDAFLKERGLHGGNAKSTV